MPLPAARHPVSDVGAARGQGPRVAPRPHPKVGGLFRRGQLEQRQVRSLHVREVRRADLRGFPEETAAASLKRQTHGGRAGQRQVPPCRASGAPPQEIPEGADLALLAAIQSAVGADRASLEARSSHVATHNRFFATLDDVLAAIDICFDRWRKPNSVLRRLCGII